MIDVPAEVRQKAAAGGAESARWLRGLGAAIESLEHDHARQALLLERLGPSLAELGLPVRMQIEIVCATLRRAWSVAPDPRFQSGAEKARALADFIAETWRALGEPCSERVVEQALSYAAARATAFDPARAVLVHGDAHGANTLRVPVDGREFKLIDPDGLFAEPACDLAVPMREWGGDLRERCSHLSRLTGVDPRPIWEWGFVERVSTGLLALEVDVGREALGRDMLAVAEALH